MILIERGFQKMIVTHLSAPKGFFLRFARFRVKRSVPAPERAGRTAGRGGTCGRLRRCGRCRPGGVAAHGGASRRRASRNVCGRGAAARGTSSAKSTPRSTPNEALRARGTATRCGVRRGFRRSRRRTRGTAASPSSCRIHRGVEASRGTVPALAFGLPAVERRAGAWGTARTSCEGEPDGERRRGGARVSRGGLRRAATSGI